MLAKKYRLNLRFEPDYKNQYSRLSAKSLTVLYYKDQSLPYPQIAILVSKKHSKKAVERNAYKRYLSSLMANHLQQLSGLKLVIIPKSPLLNKHEISSELESLLARLS